MSNFMSSCVQSIIQDESNALGAYLKLELETKKFAQVSKPILREEFFHT